ncbi:hypothetical protein [Marinobacterium stanieri]|uniref:hypothetical protein n=1 Tax=Marinobacterium stanieri TaxID=49186 RepID=UPI000255A8AB|nr:hypothetical protein [Marinobacterium stanieri]
MRLVTAVLTAILAAAVSLPATAASVRIDNKIISTGKPASELSSLGRRTYSEVGRVCKRPSNSSCSDSRSGWGRIYQFSKDGRSFTAHVYDGTIVYIKENR